ncbi:MAG TPA: peptidoglycan-binding protein [Myxococcales bacterium]|nr:peptidoglycan-binding protein [Myxococcales bacterium]
MPTRVNSGRGQSVSLRTGTSYLVVVGSGNAPSRGLRFLRGKDFDARDPSGRPAPTTVAMPLEASVVGRLCRYHRRPLECELVTVEVFDGSGSTVTVRSPRESVDLELATAAGQPPASRKKLLFWHGRREDLGGASWPDIQLLDITTSGEVPFAPEIEAKAGDAKGTLGLIDVLAEDPDAAGTWRTLRHGIFRTRAPRLKICIGALPAAELRVVLDDGVDETDDEVDVTRLFALSSPQTTVEVPGFTRLGGAVTGTLNQRVGRLRLVQESVEPTPAEGDLGLFLAGENRLRIELRGETVFLARSLHAASGDGTVPPGFFRADEVTVDGAHLNVLKGSLTLDARDGISDGQLSRLLHALRARPRAFAPRYAIVEAHLGDDVAGDALVKARSDVEGFQDPDIAAVGLTPLLVPALASGPGVQEKLPPAIAADYTAAAHTFTNRDDHWHHFVIHTFPAHRLIETQLFADSRPPEVAVAGARFETNKSFLRPEVEAEIRRVRELEQAEPERKIAIFGHTDRVDTEAHNNPLSLARAGSMNALLRHDAGFWYDRFASTDQLGNGIPERQFALHELGHFAGAINGVDDASLQAAVGAFRSAHAIGAGNAFDDRTRREIGNALLQHVGATRAALRAEAAWGLREIQAMLKRLGDYGGAINGSNDAATKAAVRAFQTRKNLSVDGAVGMVTRIALIRDYQAALVPAAFDGARFHAGAVFGCGEAFPRAPTPDGVESAQNRRVEVIFRRTAILPIDPALVGAACPYLDWRAPEFDGTAPAAPPKVVVAITDTGLGGGLAADNHSGEAGRLPNALLIKGERLLRPTDTSGANAGNPTLKTVFADGNLIGISDVANPGNGHGSAVATCLGADGEGSLVGGAPRNARQMVIGTAPHVHIRFIRISAAGGGANFFSYLLGLEAIAADPEVLVHTTSIADWIATAVHTPAQLRAFQERAQEMVMQGKLMFSVPQNFNNGAAPGRYWAGTTLWGRLGPARANARSANTGANEFQQRLTIVGATARVGTAAGLGLTQVSAPGPEIVADFSFIGEQVGVYMPGQAIRAIMPTASSLAPNLSNAVPIAADNMTIGGIDGTSFATPMTAGVAAELMLLDPDLRKPANVARVIEYIEATADPLPNIAPAGGMAGNPRNADPNLAAPGHPAFSGVRRVHFWKAVLAALNKGLSAEGRGAAGAADAHFTFCTLRDDASTLFYGFEIRAPVADATVWLRKADGELVPAQDGGAVFPGSRVAATTWRTVDALEAAPGQPLPAFPWPAASFPPGRQFFLCQFSIQKAQLAQFQSLVVHLPGTDPRDPDGPDSPPILDLRIDDRPTLRNPASIPPGDPLPRQAIRTFVQAFDDFVFHVSAVPQPLAAYLFVAQGHRTGAAVGEALTVFLYAVDRFGNLTNPGAAANVTHNGTAGTGAPAGVHLNGAPAPQAGVAPVFGAAGDPRGMARIQFAGHTAEAVTLSINDGAGHTGSIALQVSVAAAVSSLSVEVRRRGGVGKTVEAQPPFAGEPLEVLVRAIDAGGRLATGFTGDVQLSLTQGEPGSNDPPPFRGVHVKNADGDPFDAKAFTHSFAAADGGQHAFPIFAYSAGPLRIEVAGGGQTGTSEACQVVAGPVHSFAVQATTPQTAGRRFELSVTALDAHQNRVEQFAGAVQITRLQGTAPVLAPPNGVFIGDTAQGADDVANFTQADGGVRRVPVTAWRAENVQFRATHNPPLGPPVTGDGAVIVVQAAGAVHHFRLEVEGAARAGNRFNLRVTAEDASNARLTGFAGNVQIVLSTGTPFAAAAPPNPARGVLIETAPGVAGNAHAFVAADAGTFTFLITPFTAEQIVLSATFAGIAPSSTAPIVITAGLFTQLAVQPAPAPHANVPFNVVVTARDAFNNVLRDFLGQVNLRLDPGTGIFAPVPAPAGQHSFGVADNGSHTFVIQTAANGAGFRVSASDGNVQNSSAPFNVLP